MASYIGQSMGHVIQMMHHVLPRGIPRLKVPPRRGICRFPGRRKLRTTSSFSRKGAKRTYICILKGLRLVRERTWAVDGAARPFCRGCTAMGSVFALRFQKRTIWPKFESTRYNTHTTVRYALYEVRFAQPCPNWGPVLRENRRFPPQNSPKTSNLRGTVKGAFQCSK